MTDITQTPKVGGTSAADEIALAYTRDLVRKTLEVFGVDRGRIHAFLAQMTPKELMLAKVGLKILPGAIALIIAKLPLSAFAGFMNPELATRITQRVLEEFTEEFKGAADSFDGNTSSDQMHAAAKKASENAFAKVVGKVKPLGRFFHSPDCVEWVEAEAKHKAAHRPPQQKGKNDRNQQPPAPPEPAPSLAPDMEIARACEQRLVPCPLCLPHLLFDAKAATPKAAEKKLKSPMEVLGALFKDDKANRDEWNRWFRHDLTLEEKKRVMSYMPYVDTVAELEGLLGVDPAERMAHLELLENFNEGFQASKKAAALMAKASEGIDEARGKLLELDDGPVREFADKMAVSLRERHWLTSLTPYLFVLSLFAATATWLYGENVIHTALAFFVPAGLGVITWIRGKSLSAKAAANTSFGKGWQWARIPLLLVGRLARWGGDEVVAIKRLILFSLSVPFAYLLWVSSLNRPYLMFFSALGTGVFISGVLCYVLTDAVLVFVAAKVLGAATGKSPLLSKEGLVEIRNWSGSTVAWINVICLALMWLPFLAPEGVGYILGSTMFFGVQRIAHWTHSTHGRKVAYGAALALLCLGLVRWASPVADAHLADFNQRYLGGDIGLKGCEGRVRLRELEDRREAIHTKAREECGREYCSPKEAKEDAKIGLDIDQTIKGTYWSTRNGTATVAVQPKAEAGSVQEQADALLRSLE